MVFSGIPPRALNHYKPGLHIAQQYVRLQRFNDVALAVNNKLAVLAKIIPNLHYISHPEFLHADVQTLEESPEHSLIGKDGLHLSFSGCEMVCKSIIKKVDDNHQGKPSHVPMCGSITSIWDVSDQDYVPELEPEPESYSYVLSKVHVKCPPKFTCEHLVSLICTW